MNAVVKGITSLFTGDSAAEDAARKQEQITRVSQDNQRAALQAEEATLGSKRPPRGRRLLINQDTGEGGLSSTLGSS